MTGQKQLLLANVLAGDRAFGGIVAALLEGQQLGFTHRLKGSSVMVLFLIAQSCQNEH